MNTIVNTVIFTFSCSHKGNMVSYALDCRSIRFMRKDLDDGRPRFLANVGNKRFASLAGIECGVGQ